MRRSICSATFSATNCASNSGVLISWMSILICLPCAIFAISSVIFSISAPLRPITMPGRAVKIVTRIEFHARSITIFETAANWSFFFTYARISRSLCKNAGSSCGDAYQRERQSRFTPRRKPIGLTFCPIKLFLRLRFAALLRLRLLRGCSTARFPLRGFLVRFALRLPRLACFDWDFVGQNNPDVAGSFQNAGGAFTPPRHHPLHRRAFAYDRFLHDEAIDFQVRIVLRVGDRAFQRFANEERRFFRRKSEQVERCRNRQALNLTRDFAHLEGRNLRVP